MRWVTTAFRTFPLLALVALLAVPAQAVAEEATPRADDGAHVVDSRWVGPRTLDLTIASTALGKEAKTRLLLPEGWSKNAKASWPVVYLLHGANDKKDYESWTSYTDVERFTRDKQAIVVMPSADPNGYYSNWWNHGKGTPAWQTFHLDELRQILERGYHAGTQRAIAGLSMGGYGAMRYAEQRPGMFQAAASYSGIVNTTFPLVPQALQLSWITHGLDPDALWGDPKHQRPIWEAHNPAANLTALRGTRLFLSSGDGRAGLFDANKRHFDAVEAIMGVVSKTFSAGLQAANIPVRTDYYGAGTHSWAYWQRELHHSWPLLTQGFTKQRPPENGA